MLLHTALSLLALPALALPGAPRALDLGSAAQVPLNPITDAESAYSASPLTAAVSSRPLRERYDGHQVLRINWERAPQAVRDIGLNMLEVSRVSVRAQRVISGVVQFPSRVARDIVLAAI